MLCPICKIEARKVRSETGEWIFVCRDPQCPNYGKNIKNTNLLEKTDSKTKE